MAPGGGRASSSPRPVPSPRAVPSATACQDRSGGSSSTTARSATKVPRPGRGTTRPSSASRAIARCTVTGEARWRAISSLTDGRRLPGGRARAAVRTSSITRWVVLLSIMSNGSNATTAVAVTQPFHARLAPGLLLGAVGVVGFSFSLPATRMALRDLDPWVVAFGRASVAALLAAVVLLATRSPWPNRAQWRSLAIVTGGVVIGFPLLTSLALHHRTSAHAAIVVGLAPAATAVMAVLRAGERPSRAFWLASAAGTAAVLVFAFISGAGALRLTDLELLLAVALVALGYAEGGAVARELGGTRTICWALLLSVPLLAPVTAVRVAQTGFHVQLDSGFGFAYVSLVSMFAAFFAWYAGLARGGVARIGQVQLAQAPLTLLWAGAFLGERVTLGSALTAVLVVGCVAATQRAR